MKYITKENIKIAVELLTLEVGVSKADRAWEINANGQISVTQPISET